MAQHKLRSRIAQFKQPFLMGAVTSAALLSGCGGETIGTGTKQDCPAEAPTRDDDCADYSPGLSCMYEVGSCPRELRCEDGNWDDIGPACNPPPPAPTSQCPVDLPTAGTGCELYEAELTCQYGSDSSCPRDFKCSEGEWVETSPTCNPPPPEGTDECPADKPISGATCDEPGLSCEYESDSNCFRQFACNDGEWADVSPTCNPPGPTVLEDCPPQAPSDEDSCQGYVQGLSCEFDTGLSCVREFRCDDGTWQDETPPCNPPPVISTTCPEVMPEQSQVCYGYEVDLSCTYETDLGCFHEFRCSEGAWQDISPSCNPPPPAPITECPTDSPIVGESCEGYAIGLMCNEPVTCDSGVGALCGANGVWEAVVVVCNPPPPPDAQDSGVADEDSDGG